jgi:Protein of unknown function (DUF2384)
MATAVIPPPVAGYSFDHAPDLADPGERARLSRSAIRVFLNIAEKWQLTEAQARGLLNGIASSTYHAWRREPSGRKLDRKLDQDTMMRISLIIGIYKALHIYFSDQWADRWVTLGNRGTLFAGSSPIDYMLRQGQPGMLEVRRMLDSWRGGR